MAFECPMCKNDVNKLIIPLGGKLGCRECVGESKIPYNVNLGQTLDRWTSVDKKTGKEISHRISVGKNWELENRRLSKEDNKTVLNIKTNKETQR